MSWLSDAHTEWHTVNGKNVVCPLDCGVGEDVADEYAYTQADQEEHDRTYPVLPIEDIPAGTPGVIDYTEYWKDRDENGIMPGSDPWAAGARVDW